MLTVSREITLIEIITLKLKGIFVKAMKMNIYEMHSQHLQFFMASLSVSCGILIFNCFECHFVQSKIYYLHKYIAILHFICNKVCAEQTFRTIQKHLIALARQRVKITGDLKSARPISREFYACYVVSVHHMHKQALKPSSLATICFFFFLSLFLK